jgi:hypothetical protein
MSPIEPLNGWPRWNITAMAGTVLIENLIHADPRWLPFLRKIGKAPEQLAAIKFDVKVPQ